MTIDLIGYTMSGSGVDIDNKIMAFWRKSGKVVNGSINRTKPTTLCVSSKQLNTGSAMIAATPNIPPWTRSKTVHGKHLIQVSL
jgi:hypothetical protein